MATTSKAMVLTGVERIEEGSFPIPETGADDGIVRVEGTGICSADWTMFKEGRSQRGTPPVILGHEIVGVVEKIGENAARMHGVQEGDRIVLAGFKGGKPIENFISDKLLTKEATIKGVNGREIETVLPTIRLMEAGKYPLELLCSHTFPLSQAEEAIQTVGAHMEKGAIHVTVINE